MSAFTILILLIAIILNALANIFVKASANHKNENILDLITNFYLILGLLSFGLAFLAYRYVLSRGFALSITYPIMTSAGFAIVILASKYLFKETMTPIQWLGIIFLMIGIWLITYKS